MNPHRIVLRAAGVVGLLGIALIHLLDLQAKLAETPYLGVAYIALIAVSLGAAGMLVRFDDQRAWLLAGGLAAATILGYAVNRTVGMPSATGDIGNWLEPIGLASLFVEAIVVITAAYAVRDLQPARTALTSS